jgi:integrase
MTVHSFPVPDGRKKHPRSDPARSRPDGPPRRTGRRRQQPHAAIAPRRRLRSEVGLAVPLLEQLQREHRGDVYGQLVAFFDAFRITAATGRRRPVSFKTRDKDFNTLRRVLHTLRDLNMRNQNLGDLTQRQVRAVTRAWESAGLSASSLTTMNTVLRRFGCWIGKPQLAPPLATLLLHPEAGVRPSSLVKPKTWESRGIAPEDVFTAMERECPVAAMQLRMGWAFGLRVEEQLMLRPHEAHRGDLLAITRGAKGGRVRDVPIQEPWELELVEQAKALAIAHPHRILASRGRDLEQARAHYYYLCRKIGLYAKGRFPSTPHGARHSFATRRYQRNGGVPAPVLGGTMPPERLDRAVRKRVAEELGHCRPGITSAYIGSVPKLNAVAKRQHKRLVEREALLGSDPRLQELARQAGLGAFCLAGAAAIGDRLTGQALVLCEARQPLAEGLLKAILGRTSALLNVACVVTDRAAVRIGELATFEIPALAHGVLIPGSAPQLPGQLQLDVDWPTAASQAPQEPGAAPPQAP